MATKGDEDIAAGATVPGQGPVRIPEGVMKPKDMSHGSEDSTNVASGKPVNAEGCEVDESATKIPEGILKPNQTNESADVAAGELVDATGKKPAEHHAKIPEGIMKPASTS